jgi:RsiW-degrading membrane proteinase PrsW (M82 family)
MEIQLARLESRKPTVWELYSLVLLVGAGVYIPLSYALNLHILHSPLRFTGFACPLCGGTRAVTSLALGRIPEAVAYNPLALLVLVFLVGGALSWLTMVLPFRRRLVWHASRGARVTFWVVVATALVANWIYVAVSGMYLKPLEV